MPYIINTYKGGGCLEPIGSGQEPDSSLAVAMLDDGDNGATQAVWDIIDALPEPKDYRAIVAAVEGRLTESGGTIGPLPNDTIIEVERVSDQDMIQRARQYRPDDHRLIEAGDYEDTEDSLPIAIDIYNAAHT